MFVINGTDKDVWDKAIMGDVLEVQGHTMKSKFHVMHMYRADVVLGHEQLHGLVSLLNHNDQHNALAFDD